MARNRGRGARLALAGCIISIVLGACSGTGRGPERTRANPMVMSFEFQGVPKETDDAGRVVDDRWPVFRDGLEASFERIHGRTPPEHVRAFLEGIARVRGEPASATGVRNERRGTTTLLYTYRFDVVLDDLSVVSTLTREIADLTIELEDGREERVTFQPVRGAISYITTFGQADIFMEITGVSNPLARVVIWVPGTSETRVVKEPAPPGAAARGDWSSEVPRTRGIEWIYGYTELQLEGQTAPVRTGFRINIFTGRQENLSFADLEPLRAREP